MYQQDGQIAVNRQTGERLVLRGGQWQPLGQAPQTAPQPQQAPDRIYGAPKAIDPAEQVRLGLAQRADQRAAEDQTMQRRMNDLEIQQKQQNLAKANDGTGEQGKAAGFYRRALDANNQFEAQGVGPRSYVGQIAKDLAPGGMRAFVDDSKQKSADTYMSDFIAATLRYESGAAIPPSEFASQAARYFPQPGDGPQQLADKARLRATAIASLKDSAGPAAANVKLPEQPQGAPESISSWIDRRFSVKPDSWEPGQGGDLILKFRDGTTQTVDAGASGIDQSPDYIAAYRQKFGEDPPIAIRGEGGNGTPPNGGGPDGTPPVQGRDTLMGAIDAGVRGAADIATFGFADELAAAGNTIFGSGTMKENLARERAIDRTDQQVNPIARFSGQVGGALLNPLGRGISTVRGAATAGAVGGGLYGAGSGETMGGRAGNALLGAGGGALGGAALQAGANALAPAIGRGVNALRGGARSEARAAEVANAAAVAQAAQAEGVPVSRAVLDPSVRNRATYLETTRGGGNAVREGLDRTANAIEGRVSGLGRGGTGLSTEAAGETIQGAGRRFIEVTGKRADRLYTRARDLSQGAKVQPQQALGELDQQIAALKETPESNAALIRYLEGVKSDLSQPGGLSIEGIRSLRTNLRGQIDQANLTASNADRIMSGVLEKASGDIEAALGSNPEALNAFRQADKFYRERMSYIDDVVRNMLGTKNAPLSAEKAFGRLSSMARSSGDARRLREIMKSASPEEAQNIAATFASTLGRDSAGEFSPTLFVTQAEKLSPAARKTLFGDDGAQSIENLMKVAREYRATTRNLNNSRTGVATNYRGWLGNALGLAGGVGGFATGGGLTGAAVAGMALKGAASAVQNTADRLSAKALMSPEITKWLASAPRSTNPEAINAHIRRLSAIAAKSPNLASEVAAIEQRIASSISQLPGGAMASGPNGSEAVPQRRKEPVQ